MRSLPKVSLLITWAAVATTAIAAPQYQIFDLGVLQVNDHSGSIAVSPGGIVVGGSGNGNGGQSFTWTQGGGLVALPLLSGRSSSAAFSANDNGTVVGRAFNENVGDAGVPVIWQNGVASQLPLPSGFTVGYARAVNASGIAVGSAGDGGEWAFAAIYSVGGSSIITAPAPQGSQFETAYGINDSGRIVGIGFLPSNPLIQLGIVYDMPTNTIFDVGTLPGASSTIALAVNNNGQVAGASGNQPFIWTEGSGMVAIPLLPGTDRGDAQGVNSAGWVVGTDRLVNTAFAPFLYDGTTTYRLADLLPPGSGWVFEGAPTSINDNGIIVGSGVHNGNRRAFAMVPLKIAFIRDPRTFESVPEIYTMNGDGTNLTRLTFTGGVTHFYDDPKWSPDGTKIACKITPVIRNPPPPSFGHPYIAVLSALGGGGIPLTGPSTRDSEPAWHPGGTKIAFTSERDGHSEIYLMDADGSNEVRLTYSASSSQAAWSPDGTKIAFTTQGQVYAMDPNGTNPVSLTNSQASGAAWSPDGTKIAFESNRDGTSDIYVMDANGSNQIRITNDAEFEARPTWSPDGTQIAFWTGRDGNWEIYAIDVNGSNLTNLTNDSLNDWQPDWQRQISPLVIPTPTPPPTPTATPTPTPSPMPATHFEVVAPSMVGMFQSFNFTVRAVDQFGDTATGYAGTIHFTSTSTGSLPPDSTLTSGTGTFAATFFTEGNQTITATDTLHPSITGTSNTILVVDDQVSPPPTPTPTPTPSPTTTPTPSPTPTPTATASPTPPTQTLNLSTRMRVQTGDNAGIGGFIITGTGSKQVLFRGIGPSLIASGITDALANPTLDLRDSSGVRILANNNWREDPAQEALIEATGIPPTDDLEAAIVQTLAPGIYTVILRGMGMATGVGLVEIYDLNPGVDSKLANLSTRALIDTGNNIVIAGFILGGSGNDRIVARGIGPSLSALGVPNALPNPTLELRDGNGTLLMANDDWQDDPAQAAELTAAGLAPTNDLESGIAATLAPGLYTALLAGANNGTGVGLVEVYDLGPPP